jgi:hypothetical protein
VGSSLCRVKPKIIKFVFAASPLSKAGKDIFKSKNNHLLLIMNNREVILTNFFAEPTVLLVLITSRAVGLFI